MFVGLFVLVFSIILKAKEAQREKDWDRKAAWT